MSIRKSLEKEFSKISTVTCCDLFEGRDKFPL